MRTQVKKQLTALFVSAAVLILYCEYLNYYVVLTQCSWPSFRNAVDRIDAKKSPLKAMFIADTHLLGPVRGHWFDKLRREWQMHRSFQTALHLFDPEVIFFLGDVFDEGQLVNVPGFDHYVNRFRSLFSVPVSTKTYVIVGNHDIGFHYWITPLLTKRFEKAFNSSAVRRIREKDVNFVLVNSMAMEGDGCFLCKPAVQKITEIEGELNCEQNVSRTECSSDVKSYSRPILLQHFPLFRPSDATCVGDDAASESEKIVKFRPKLDCLSEASSQFLLQKLKPRLILSGHTHHGCLYEHLISSSTTSVLNKSVVPEYSVSSFSWRNRDNPTFLLGQFTSEDYQLSKCSLPRESTVVLIYYCGGILILLLLCGYVPFYSVFKRFGGMRILIFEFSLFRPVSAGMPELAARLF